MEGTYKYFLNEEPSGIIERFSIKTRPDGKTETVSERDASDFGTQIFTKAIQDNDLFERFEIRMLNQNNPEVADVCATYEFSNGSLSFGREINGESQGDETIQLPEDCVVFPLMRCFQGETILKVADRNKPTNVLVPSIENPDDPGELLKPTFDKRTAKKLETDPANHATVYNYLSKHYSENSKFWIDENGTLVKYVFHQSEDTVWTVELSQ